MKAYTIGTECPISKEMAEEIVAGRRMSGSEIKKLGGDPGKLQKGWVNAVVAKLASHYGLAEDHEGFQKHTPFRNGVITRGSSEGCTLQEASIASLHGFNGISKDPKFLELVRDEIDRRDLAKPNTPKRILPPSWRMRFGKHEGHRLIDIIVSDPEYMMWLINNNKWIADSISEDLRGFAEDVYMMGYEELELLKFLHEKGKSHINSKLASMAEEIETNNKADPNNG